ncbi:hypothetical protein DFH06DRAFT_1393704, partial [Mycena polygramma]
MSQDQPQATAIAADELKNRGNAFFKAGNAAEASKCYAKAEELNPTNPVYSSNLSASLFEEGDYVSCAKAINRWCHLEEAKTMKNANPNLGLRLSARLAKALSHGARGGFVQQNLLHEIDATIRELKALTETGEPELRRLWNDWDRVEAEASDRDSTAAARERFSTLPMFRKVSISKPFLEYFSIGQDPLMSLSDDWGPACETPLKIQTMPDEDLSRLSFIFGGVGDARNVYSTLVGLHRAHKKLDAKRQGVFRVHITLLDIHPTALARDLCVLLLLNQLIETPAMTSIAKAEILSTVFYTFAGVVMPEYCHNRLQKVVDDLKMALTRGNELALPSWIYVDSAAAPKIIAILDFWSSVPLNFNTEDTLSAHTASSPAGVLELVKSPNMSQEFRAGVEASIARHRAHIMKMIETMTETQLREMDLAPPGQNASAEEKRQLAIRREDSINGASNLLYERFWYERVKIFVPHPELWSKHVGMDLFRGMTTGSPPSFKKLSKASGERDTILYLYSLISLGRKTYQPNLETQPDPLRKSCIPNLDLDPFEAPGYIDLFNQRFGINSFTENDAPDAPALSNCLDLFNKVVEALSSLQTQTKLEFICGELTQELLKMSSGCDTTRPAHFPRVYDRGHLSNVPDYTHGTLNTIIYALPVVKEVSSNCYLNKGIWANDEEFIHTYTLLKSANVPRYLGCQFTHLAAIDDLVILRKQELPLPLTKLATRPELITWLTRVLLYTLVPSSSHQGRFRSRRPHNLVAFIALLMYLHGVGYPAHWLSEFLQTILSGSLVTDIALYTANWPIPVSDITRRVPARAVRLDPWTAELETILATGLQAIPFSVPLADDLVSHHTDIGTFEAKVKADLFQMGNFMGVPPPADPVVGLLLYKLTPGVSADTLVTRLPLVLDGARSPEPGTLCVLTAQETVDPPVIRWKLSKARVARMREEGWAMVAYRTDTKSAFTDPVRADRWREV